jgi:prepilin-type N-terminal cleavage/methylation domain-containing protein/prepilin-type processing-associated H-X9-DG protein
MRAGSFGFGASKKRRADSAFTIVELLVTIAILALLTALLLPAVQSARESARRSHCQSNLRQIALALAEFHDGYKMFPNGGWGHEWVGDPDRGVGIHQPGGWIYAVLPFIDESSIHDLGKGVTGTPITDAYSMRLQTSVPLLTCPTRRTSQPWPISPKYAYVRTPKPFGDVSVVARADYAINGGTSNAFSFAGPADLSQGDDPQFWARSPTPIYFNGISHLRVSVSLNSIEDGASKTYLGGEKYIESSKYDSGESVGDNESMYAGYCTDLHRFTGSLESLKVGLSPWSPPLSDQTDSPSGTPGTVRFGSGHASACNMMYCDGSVSAVTYDVDPELFLRVGHRNDAGDPIELLK